MKVCWNIDGEQLEWYCLTPEERWQETQKLWQFYLSTGGSLDPEPDSQSPFNPFYTQSVSTSNGRASMHTIRGI